MEKETEMTTTVTPELLAKVLPTSLKSAATQDLADMLNAVSTDPDAADFIRENFISYTKVLQDGKYKTEDYLNAVKYVSFKLMKASNEEAYIKTFPQRYQNMVASGKSKKDISAYVHAYSRNKLVIQLLQQSVVPFWLINQDYRQEALMTQVELMRTAASEKVRSDAANSVLTHLEQPKEVGPAINFDMRESAGLQELKQALVSLAQGQIQAIQAGATVTDIAGQSIMDVQAKDVSDAS